MGLDKTESYLSYGTKYYIAAYSSPWEGLISRHFKAGDQIGKEREQPVSPRVLSLAGKTSDR